MQINAAEYDEIAREVFAPIYPIIAEQIQQNTGITSGTCLDVGCGGGYLGLALAKITDLQVYLFDESRDMLKIAAQNIDAMGLKARVHILQGDVHDIPIKNQMVNLIVSRGSMFFWENQPRAFQEIYRVLAPGGMTYIGGGFGNAELKQQIDLEMTARDPEWPEKTRNRISKNNSDKFRKILIQAEIPNFEVNQTDAGLWIIIRR